MRARSALRIPCRSWADATEFALRLRADGYVVGRIWKTVTAYTATPEEAERLARKLGLRPDARSSLSAVIPSTSTSGPPGMHPPRPVSSVSRQPRRE
jgi:phage terminase small subunit